MKKECEMINDLLPLYIDGVCSEESKRLVEEHMKTCDACRKTAEQMKSDLVLPMKDSADVKGFTISTIPNAIFKLAIKRTAPHPLYFKRIRSIAFWNFINPLIVTASPSRKGMMDITISTLERIKTPTSINASPITRLYL